MSSLPQDDLVTDGASPHTPSTFPMNGTGVDMIFAGDKASQSAAIVMRLSTYGSQKMTNAILLASSGFSYDEKSKTVKCFECGCTIDVRNPGDPLTVHKRSSPNCSFFSPASRNVSTAPPEMTSMPIRSSAPTPAPVNKKNTSLQTPKYSQYLEHSARLATYQGWPLEAVKQFPDYLAKCGFFYIGSADRVRCFFCGITLRNWEAEDDPFIEHKNWAPRCTFIQTLPQPNRHSSSASIPVPSAGSQMPTSTSEHPDSDHCSLPMAQSHHQPAAHQHSIGGVTHSSNSSSPAGSHPSRPPMPGPSPSLPHAKSGSSDFMSSPTVLAVIEMGFAREVVEEVVRQKIAADSTPFSNASELYLAVDNHVSSN